MINVFRWNQTSMELLQTQRPQVRKVADHFGENLLCLTSTVVNKSLQRTISRSVTSSHPVESKVTLTRTHVSVFFWLISLTIFAVDTL